jgi:WD40 repeat protein
MGFRNALAALALVVAVMSDVCAQGLRTLARHREIAAVAISPDGSLVASASNVDGTVKLFFAGSASFTSALAAPFHVDAMEFSLDGDLLAIAGGTRFAIHLYNVPWPGLVRAIEDSSRSPARSIAFSPDSTTIAAADDDSVTLWSVATGEHLRTLRAPAGARGGLRFNADGSRLYAAGASGIERWDLATGEHSIALATNAPVIGFDVARDERSAVTATTTIELWDLRSGDRLQMFGEVHRHGDVAFAREDSLVIAGGPKGIRMWDRSTGTLVQTLVSTEDSTLGDARIAVYGDRLLTGSPAGGLRLWSAGTGDELAELVPADRFLDVRASPRGDAIALVSERSGIVTYSGEAQAWGMRPIASRGPFLFSPGGDALAVWMRGEIVVHDARSGDSLRALSSPRSSQLGHAFDWSRASFMLAAAEDSAGRIHVWSRDGAYVRTLVTTSATVSAVHFIGSELLAALGIDGLLTVWDVATWDTVLTLDASAVAAGPGGFIAGHGYLRELAIGGESDTLVVIDPRSGEVVRRLGHPSRVRLARYGNEFLHTVADDGVLRIWYNEEPQALTDFNDHASPTLSFDLDEGAWFLTAVAADGSAVLRHGIGYANVAGVAAEPPIRSRVYPHPATDVARIETANAMSCSIHVLDHAARTRDVSARIVGPNMLELDVRALESGAYHAIVREGDRVTAVPFVVRR